MSFRNRLYEIENEDELFKFFEHHAGALDGVYYCAGIWAGDTKELLDKLREAWKEDKRVAAKELLKRHV